MSSELGVYPAVSGACAIDRAGQAAVVKRQLATDCLLTVGDVDEAT